MNKISKICIIIPYFGKWPKWINYFLHSCSYNPTIDWMFFTDCGLPDVTSGNLIFHQMTLYEFNEYASKQLGFDLVIKDPYKLCDLKPTYGLLFQEYLKDYDFWGYGDIDLVYGNIRNLINEDVLAKFDLVTFHPDFIPGHFCLLKNIGALNHLFKKCPIWKSIFQQDRMYSFSEIFYKRGIRLKSDIFNLRRRKIYVDLLKTFLYKSNFIKSLFLHLKLLFNNKNDLVKLYDFSSLISHAGNAGEINIFRKKLYLDDIELLKNRMKKWEIVWEKGSLYFENKEILYFHFQFYKFSQRLKLVDNIEALNSFKIIKN